MKEENKIKRDLIHITKTVDIYQCPVCKSTFIYKEAAQKCLDFHSIPVDIEVPEQVRGRNVYLYRQYDKRKYPKYITVEFDDGEKIQYSCT